MGKKRVSNRRERRISVRAVRRAEPDLRRIGRALLSFTLAQAEAAAQTEKTTKTRTPGSDHASNEPGDAA